MAGFFDLYPQSKPVKASIPDWMEYIERDPTKVYTTDIRLDTFTNPETGETFQGDMRDMRLKGKDMDSDITSMPTNTWGAPTGYDPSQQQQGNMFNPYSIGNNNYYNPYSFGQTTSGTQYGGGQQQQPWWMNYNMGNSAVNPFNTPTTNVQPQAQGQSPRNRGTGPNGKDLTYDETIKYFGLYDNAESAIKAGDSQAAYRKDHMQWRSGTGNYEGMGEGQGQYPGRPELGIAGDVERMGNLSGMFGGFNPFSMFNTKTNEQGGTDVTVGGEGTMTTGDGTTVETQFTNQNNIPPEFRTSGDGFPFGLKRGAFNNPNIFYPNTNTTPFGPAAPTADQRNWIRNNNTYVANDDSSTFSINDIPNLYSNIRNGGKSGLADTEDSRFRPSNLYNQGKTQRPTVLENYRSMLGLDNFTGQEQVSQFGITKNGMTMPTPDNQLNIFSSSEPVINQGIIKPYDDRYQVSPDEQNILLDRIEAQGIAQEARITEIAAAAEKERQATAAQKRRNDNYETGYVPPNIFTSGTGGSSSGRKGRGSYNKRYGL